MKFIIKHEARGRMRIHLVQYRMSYAQADLLLYYLHTQPQVKEAKVYERTGDAVVVYTGDRQQIIDLLLAFAYMRFVLGVEFGGRDGLAMLALAACALMSTALGAAIGAIPKISIPGKTGIATGITCFCALFAGLYGEPSMQLADRVSQSAPWAVLVNPAAQAANAFYDLTYYDSLAPFFATLCVLAVMAAVFFVVAALLMRRQNYERL